MTRTIFPMEVADLSAFAKLLRDQIARLDHAPSHVEMLNLLSRAAGYRNYQQFRSTAGKTDPLRDGAGAVDALPRADETRVARTLRVFDADARIIRWPSKRSQQELCLWLLWSRIPPKRSFSEREISDLLNGFHLFGDAALLRRDLVDLGLMRRNRDGSDYRRLEKAPPPELKLLVQKLAGPTRKAA